jgi:hypothetical protein
MIDVIKRCNNSKQFIIMIDNFENFKQCDVSIYLAEFNMKHRHFPTIIPLNRVDTTCFSSCCDKGTCHVCSIPHSEVILVKRGCLGKLNEICYPFENKARVVCCIRYEVTLLVT